MKKLAFIFIALMFLAGVAQAQFALEDLEELAPIVAYTGVIKNTTWCDVSIPSANSGATITVPARGWVEYTVWVPAFTLIAYRYGQPYHCQEVQVDPQQHQFLCRNYDFVAEIVAAKPKKKRPVRKKRRPKKPIGPEVEGLG